MIEYPSQSRQLRNAASDLEALLRFGHRWMRALRYQSVKLRDIPPGQEVGGHGKKKIGVIVSCLVWNDCKHAFAGRDIL